MNEVTTGAEMQTIQLFSLKVKHTIQSWDIARCEKTITATYACDEKISTHAKIAMKQ